MQKIFLLAAFALLVASVAAEAPAHALVFSAPADGCLEEVMGEEKGRILQNARGFHRVVRNLCGLPLHVTWYEKDTDGHVSAHSDVVAPTKTASSDFRVANFELIHVAACYAPLRPVSMRRDGGIPREVPPEEAFDYGRQAVFHECRPLR